MWTVVKVQGTEVLRDVLQRWKAGIDAQAPECAAEAFTRDAIFQGLHSYSVGRQGVIEYALPPGYQTATAGPSTPTPRTRSPAP